MASLGWKGHLKDSNLVLNCKTGKTEAYSMPSPYTYWLVLSNMLCLFMPPGLPKLFPSPLVWLTPLTGDLF